MYCECITIIMFRLRDMGKHIIIITPHLCLKLFIVSLYGTLLFWCLFVFNVFILANVNIYVYTLCFEIRVNADRYVYAFAETNQVGK